MSMNPQAPGVYVNFMPSGIQPIEGVATAITAFVGFTEKAELSGEDGISTVSARNKAVLVTSWDQYQKHFGGYIDSAYTPYAVKGYFDNGGKIAYVISILDEKLLKQQGAKSVHLHRAQLVLQNVDLQKPTPTLHLAATVGGLEGNAIAVKVEHSSLAAEREKFNLIVFGISDEPIELSDLTMDTNNRDNFVENRVNHHPIVGKAIEARVLDRSGIPSQKRPAEIGPVFLGEGERIITQIDKHFLSLSHHLAALESQIGQYETELQSLNGNSQDDETAAGAA